MPAKSKKTKKVKSNSGFPLMLLAAGLGYVIYKDSQDDKLTLTAKLTRNIQFEAQYAGNPNYDYSTYA